MLYFSSYSLLFSIRKAGCRMSLSLCFQTRTEGLRSWFHGRSLCVASITSNWSVVVVVVVAVGGGVWICNCGKGRVTCGLVDRGWIVVGCAWGMINGGGSLVIIIWGVVVNIRALLVGVAWLLRVVV